MSQRKLQSEIDRTLKKVSEGVKLLESAYDNMQASTNQIQKERLESEYKMQLSKLQRLRDQIKTWIASNDIKDKPALLENKRLIDIQMEKFKACENGKKTKAFSKEEAIRWVNRQMEELQTQVEETEADLETMQATGKKQQSEGSRHSDRQKQLECLNDRRKWHIRRLEIVLRLLNNGSLAVDKVNDLKEDLSYFVECNMDETFDEDESIYDELHLNEEEERFYSSHDSPAISDAKPASHSPTVQKDATSSPLVLTQSPSAAHTPAPESPVIAQPQESSPQVLSSHYSSLRNIRRGRNFFHAGQKWFGLASRIVFAQ